MLAILLMSGVYICRVKEGSISSAFMPTALDARSHKKLRFSEAKVDNQGALQIISSTHPQNPEILVEGTKVSPSSSKYVVGVIRDEDHTSIYLYDGDVFSVQAMVRLSAITDSKKDATGVQAYLEKKKELINTYAPVKKQRQLRAAVNSIVSDEKIEGFEESMGTMRDSLKEEESRLEQLPKSQQSGVIGQMKELLPPFDLEATSPGGIYDFGALFGESLMNSLTEPLNDETSVTGFLHKWVSDGVLTVTPEEMVQVEKLKTVHQLVRLFAAHKHEKKKNMTKLVSILVSMIFLFKEKRKKNWTSYDVYASSEVLAERLGELYTIDKRTGGTVDRECGQKLLAHICLFILRLTPFWEFDFGDLKADLSIQLKDIASTMAFCGITFKSGALLGRLKAPLVIQEAYTGGQRKNNKK